MQWTAPDGTVVRKAAVAADGYIVVVTRPDGRVRRITACKTERGARQSFEIAKRRLEEGRPLNKGEALPSRQTIPFPEGKS